MALSQKELDFCRYYAFCRNHREAAAKAGFAFPEKSGAKLLEREDIISAVESASDRYRRISEAADGFRRIAFGSVADAVKLVLDGGNATEADKLDLFMVSEIKISKGGGIEIKFFDRIKALEELASISDGKSGDGAIPFIDAIFKGAAALDGAVRSDDDDI